MYIILIDEKLKTPCMDILDTLLSGDFPCFRSYLFTSNLSYDRGKTFMIKSIKQWYLLGKITRNVKLFVVEIQLLYKCVCRVFYKILKTTMVHTDVYIGTYIKITVMEL